jgi:CRISPR-associated protein Csx3
MIDPSPATTLPAVLVGGPPHSGKSVLIYSLSQALRARGVDHYALRACPDGEGDWSNEAPPDLVREIRFKGPWTGEWVERITRDIDRRHLPLLVDVGGKPTPEQAAMFGHCTHAVLLTPHAQAQAVWRGLVADYSLPVLADITSVLAGEDALATRTPAITGVICGLERNTQAKGPVFAALVDRLAQLLAADRAELRRAHLAAAPVEIAIDLDRLARTLGVTFQGEQSIWQPADVPRLVDYLPAAKPLAVYGRGTVWVYAALARLASPARFASYDVRLGWVDAAPLRVGETTDSNPVNISVDRPAGAFRLTVTLPQQYLDYTAVDQVVVPPAPSATGVILSGKLPIWLFTSLAITYHAAPWLAVFQPQLGGSVVVYSADARVPVGEILPA